MTVELTSKEQAIISGLVDVWNLFVDLPDEHGDDMTEFRHGIHALQEKILARPTRRLINARKPITCLTCSSKFLTGHLTGRRSTAQYCSDRCRKTASRAKVDRPAKAPSKEVRDRAIFGEWQKSRSYQSIASEYGKTPACIRHIVFIQGGGMALRAQFPSETVKQIFDRIRAQHRPSGKGEMT